MSEKPKVLHRIDYTKWGLHAEAGKLGQVVVCAACGKHGVCKLNYRKSPGPAGKEIVVPHWDSKVIHSGHLQEVLVGTLREVQHVIGETCVGGPRLVVRELSKAPEPPPPPSGPRIRKRSEGPARKREDDIPF
jgi:hypothetical protein